MAHDRWHRDILFNTEYRWFALDVPANCATRYGIQPVAAHELAFGLGHVSESSHPT